MTSRQTIATMAGAVVAYTSLGLFVGWMMVNTVLRCGDAIYYTDGTWRTGDCWLHWHTPVEGTW